MTPVTQFVFFRVKPSVRPEEGDQNREGEQLLDLFRETILQSGHIGSAWGRTLEDENVLVWVIGIPLRSLSSTPSLIQMIDMNRMGRRTQHCQPVTPRALHRRQQQRRRPLNPHHRHQHAVAQHLRNRHADHQPRHRAGHVRRARRPVG
jgi:hypothetical protein